MPIEIKELHIKINVKEGANNEQVKNDVLKIEDKQTLIETSIEEMMQLLHKQKER